MKLIAAMRCRSYTGVPGYRLEFRERVSNTLTGVQKDNVVVEIYRKDDRTKSGKSEE